MERHLCCCLLAGAFLLLAACTTTTPARELRPPPRTLGVTQGPELVFGQPVEAVLPELAGATPTGVNGRVGPELVFWTYRLNNGREVLFHACAPMPGVDCALREARMCARGTPRRLAARLATGEVRRRQCQAIGTAAVGELRPGCSENEFESELVTGLSECPLP